MVANNVTIGGGIDMEEKKGATSLHDNSVDSYVDKSIQQCLSLDTPKSFFVFAGAGSGKTESLIRALQFIDKEFGTRLSMHSKQVAVITYTNNAVDEILRRIQYKPVFAVSTIHSFLWELIKHYQKDIKDWVKQKLEADIIELKKELANGRGGNTAEKRRQDVEKKTLVLANIEKVRRFSYNPNGENVGYASLSHNDVILMGCEFLTKEKTMQEILVSKYPIVLIDESQDTKKELVDALRVVYDEYKSKFIIGMFGDTMQRIYMDGKENLRNEIPAEWEKIEKTMNYRSAIRIVELANSIRSTVDGQQQQPRSDAEMGTVCLFIADSCSKKDAIEQQAAQIMARKTQDNNWLDNSRLKKLILEHHMAASRFGFSNLYTPLNDSKAFDTSLREGTIPELSFLANVVSPLVKAYQENNDFLVSKIVRQYSPLLDKRLFLENSEKQIELLEIAQNAVEELLGLWKDGAIPTCIDVLRILKKTNLFDISATIDEILSDEKANENIKVTALRQALSVPFDELERYSAYVQGNTPFATHQGVKGLEFDRVMVIMDDSAAKGNLFSYEKLFGAKSKTATDIKNEREGKETSILRTTRLFYVACTRARDSLAVVAYTQNIEAVKNTAISNGWFSEEEIEIL